MRVSLGKRQVKVKWHYEKDIRVITHCQISAIGDTEAGKETEVLAIGIAYKSFNDQHDKQKARKVSLHKALNQGDFSKEDRARIWYQYGLEIGF